MLVLLATLSWCNNHDWFFHNSEFFCNKEYYLEVIHRSHEPIWKKKKKHQELWKNQSWLSLHDNAPTDISLLVCNFLAKTPPNSPDLVPCDFFQFPKLKRPMKGRRFATIEQQIKTALLEELKTISRSAYQKCFEDWKKRLVQVYYIWGGLLWRGQYRYWWINKYFLRKFTLFFEQPT